MIAKFITGALIAGGMVFLAPSIATAGPCQPVTTDCPPPPPPCQPVTTWCQPAALPLSEF